MARTFDVLVTVENSKVIRYTVFNDFRIVDWKRDRQGWLLMCDDWENHTEFRAGEGKLKIIRLDTAFMELWTYAPVPVYPVYGRKIVEKEGFVSLLVNLVTASHMVLDNIEIKLDDQGRCISAVQVGSENSPGNLPLHYVERVFPVHRPERH